MKEKKRNDLKYFTSLGIVIQFGVVVVSNIFVDGVIGYFIDKWTLKNKLFLIVFLFLGVASGLYNGVKYLLKEAQKYEKHDKDANDE